MNPRWPAVWAARARVARAPDEPGLYLALAPMDGVTDAVYRALLTDQAGGESGVSLCVSEFVRVTGAAVPAHVIRKHCPEVDAGGRTAAGVPVFVQLLGGAPAPMAATAARAAELGAPGIDLNFGCPAKTVNRHDGGATLLKAPARILEIVRVVRDAVPPRVPVTVKIRIGWDSGDSLEAIAAAAEEGGAAWLTIHARTRAQGYKPPVHWHALARARAAVRSLPLVANGDVRTVDDLAACAHATHCEAFMIGRGAMGAPTLFRQARDPRVPPLSMPAFAELLLRYFERLVAAGATEPRALCRVKQWLRMGAEARPEIAWLFAAIKVRPAWPPARDLLRAVADGLEPWAA
ncbi:MAG: tRNA-dihydrouridine synthase, partial [Myxococcales bacterium]|nr:tRNA-dihydrouridine synthase [Myxococcales bacterium]